MDWKTIAEADELELLKVSTIFALKIFFQNFIPNNC